MRNWKVSWFCEKLAGEYKCWHPVLSTHTCFETVKNFETVWSSIPGWKCPKSPTFPFSTTVNGSTLLVRENLFARPEGSEAGKGSFLHLTVSFKLLFPAHQLAEVESSLVWYARNLVLASSRTPAHCLTLVSMGLHLPPQLSHPSLLSEWILLWKDGFSLARTLNLEEAWCKLDSFNVKWCNCQPRGT